jgi:two-component system, OmpR family, KDP operon response regulator KdpE
MSDPPLIAVLVEDERQIRRFVREALETEGWTVFEAEIVKRGLVEAGTRKPDLIVLDLGLPDGDGVDLIREVRGWSQVPIIVLSARAGETDKIAALDAGADDYLTKPFGVGELLARVRAARRRKLAAGTGKPSVRFGDVEVDLTARIVRKQGEAVHLTPIEYRLLALLIASAGRVLTHRHICREVWGPAHEESTHYARIYMGHLRQKLEDDPARPKYIVTETGVGYRLSI